MAATPTARSCGNCPSGPLSLDESAKMPNCFWPLRCHRATLVRAWAPARHSGGASLVNGIPATEREFMVYLPLRNGVTSLEFGVPKGATIKPGPAQVAGSNPIVFYGTSITHGIGASRAGMTHVAMLGRTFNREVINLGFSGNGRMEPEVVKFVAELDPAVFVLDCLPNMNGQQVTERVVPGVKLLRDSHPDTPILLVEDRNI